MEPDGTTRIIFLPYLPAFRRAIRAAAEREEAAAIKALLATVEELGETPTFTIPFQPPRPKNWRPWHKHTLPNRRRR